MANVREETPRTADVAANPVTGAGDAPKVEVYDTNTTTPRTVMMDNDSRARTAYNTPTPVSAAPGANWTGIIIGLVVVLALIALLMWIF